MKTRHAAVEGRFYPSTKKKIFDQIRSIEEAGRYPDVQIRPHKVFGAVVPHAGHLYSGHQTVPFFQLLRKLERKPETFVIVHPNHTGCGLPVAIDDSDVWVNSIGEVPLDRDFAEAMHLPFDRRTHSNEHSAEVIIPFTQYYFIDQPFSIVPVCMGEQGHVVAKTIADSILDAIKQTGRDIMLLASCDFSHFLPPDLAMEKDQFVLDAILSRDTIGVETAVKEQQVSVCGYGPIMTLMHYSASLDPDYNLSILARGSSGDVSQSPEVVDYISMIMYQ
ncbi:MAG: AmmeMemoRadiSam system protein B [Bacteroidota bacterium]